MAGVHEVSWDAAGVPSGDLLRMPRRRQPLCGAEDEFCCQVRNKSEEVKTLGRLRAALFLHPPPEPTALPVFGL